MADPQQAAPAQFDPTAPYSAATPPAAPAQAAPASATATPPAQFDPNAPYAASTPSTQQPQRWIDSDSGDGVSGFLGNAVKGGLKGLSDIGGSVLNTLGATDEDLNKPNTLEHMAVDPIKAIVKTLWNTSIPGAVVNNAVDTYKSKLVPAVSAFEAARSNGASLTDAYVAADKAARDHDQLIQAASKAADEFKKNPTATSVRGLVDVVGALGTAYALHGAGTGTEAAAGDTAAGADVETAPAATSATPTPREATIAKAVSNSGLKPGTPPDVAPTPAQVQDSLHSGLRATSASVAKDAGVGYENPDSIRDVFGTTARAVVNDAKGNFQALDQASGGRWQRFDDQLKNIQQKMSEVSGIDDDAYSALETKQNEVETLQSQMIEDMKAAGKVDPAIADQAVAQYRRGMALQDVSNAVKVATKRTPVTDVADGASQVTDTVDPNMLANRLAKLDDVPPNGGPSRLEQALGRKGADQLLDQVDNAQIANQQIKDWVPSTPTGKDALQGLVEKNSAGTKIDWNGVQKDFSNLPGQEIQKAFGEDAATAQKYIANQARYQNAATGIKRVVGYGGAAGAVEELTRRGIDAVVGADNK